MRHAQPACAECGMIVQLGEYHPFAACLMYKGCKDSTTVRENIKAITSQWRELGQRQKEHKAIQLIQDDAWAITHQSLGQYRKALAKTIKETSE